MQKSLRIKVKAVILVELLIAITILVIAMAALLGAFVGCLLLNESNHNLVVALNDAQYILEEIKALPYSSISAYSPPQLAHLSEELITFSASDISARLKSITVTVRWTERSSRQRQASLSTYVAR
jgi:hypothetical protein